MMIKDTSDHRTDPRWDLGMKIYHNVMNLYATIGRRSRDKEKEFAFRAFEDGVITSDERWAMCFFIDMAD